MLCKCQSLIYGPTYKATNQLQLSAVTLDLTGTAESAATLRSKGLKSASQRFFSLAQARFVYHHHCLKVVDFELLQLLGQVQARYDKGTPQSEEGVPRRRENLGVGAG